MNVNVSSSYSSSDNAKLVTIDLSTGTSSESTEIAQIDEFILKLRPQIEDLNSRYDTQIVIVHLRITDTDNKLLVEYMRDFETGRQSSWTAENIEGNWYPQPAPIVSSEPQETSVPVITPTATYQETIASPAPTTQPAAYPPPPTSTANPYP